MKKPKVLSKLALVLCAAMLLATGCGTKAASSDNPSSAASATESKTDTSSTASADNEVPNLSGLEFKFFGQTRSPYDPDQKIIWDELEKRTGAKVTYQWVAQSDYKTKLNSILAGTDLPDVIFEGDMATQLNEGAILPLDDALAKYGANITRNWNDDDYLYLRQVSDGKIYHIPYVLDYKYSMSTLARTDWIKKLGMEVPTSYDDWKKVWYAMKANDCNGNGDANDEIPIVCTNAGDLLSYATMFGIKVSNNWWAETDDGLVSVFEAKNFDKFLNEMRTLYADGILDKEFASRSDTYKNTLDSGLAGFTIYYAERAKITTLALQQAEGADAHMEGVAPVKYENEAQLIRARTKVGTVGLTVTIAAKDKLDDIVKYYNYVFSDEGNILMNYGIEGKTFDYVDGKPVIKQDIASGSFTKARSSGLICTLTPINFLGDAYEQLLLAGQSVDSLDSATKMFYDALYLNEDYFYTVIPSFNTTEYQENGGTLGDKLTTAFAQCVSGQISTDEFWKQYQSIKDEGWQDVIDAQVAAYNKLMKK